MSGYLAGKGVGETVEIRGPHLGFDVKERLGKERRVVFLAGGTGIAPALQVVHALESRTARAEGMDKGGMPRVDIVWANRSRLDCVGGQGLGSDGLLMEGDGGLVMEMLRGMQRRLPGKITVRCAVDEEGSFIDGGVVGRVTGFVTAPKERSWPWGSARTRQTEHWEAGNVRPKCWVHDQERVALRPATETESDACKCGEGRKLLFVSGPDGFVEYLAGAKRWAGGMELQGPLGGLVGELERRYLGLGKEWLVLKL